MITSSTNLGFAGGNNLALRQIRTPYAVLLNNDATPQPGWLRNLLGEFDEPGGQDVGIVTSKILFMPQYIRVQLGTPGFRPGPQDTRNLGVRVYRVTVDGSDVTDKVLWEQAAYGPEGEGTGRFRWTRPAGEFLVPVPRESYDRRSHPYRTGNGDDPRGGRGAQIADALRGRSTARRGRSTASAVDVASSVKPGADVVDVINNAGGIVLSDGSGADRGFQEVDSGQYDKPGEVFAGCGNGMALRTVVGHELGWFDDAFFMYYEDTDLSWRWRSRGWSVRYVPSAVLRHVHAASSKEWSPRWVFYVERNRLLMLTKNATAALAYRAVWSYVRSTGVMVVRALADALTSPEAAGAARNLASPSGPAVLRAPGTSRSARTPLTCGRRLSVPAPQLQAWLVRSR